MENNNNLIPIPGRLHDVSTDGVVSGADEIFDDAKGKRQSVINQETDAALDNKYDKDETYSKQELNNLITTPNQDYVTVPTYASLPATGEADTVYRVSNYDGEQSQVDATKYSEYAWDGTQYIFLCVKTQIGEVFDITAYNSNTKYADLTAALGTGGVNIPEGLRKGGMSVKYVQTSDNMYIQHRCIADDFTTDTRYWVTCEEGAYVENPEFVYVKADAEGKILWAIKTDGSIYYGAGVPKQVKDYIEEKISSLSLDEYEDIVAFLSDYLGSNTTLKVLIDSKLDAEGLDPDALNSAQAIENPKYMQVTTDSEGKILEDITTEGRKEINIPIDTPAASFEPTQNPKWLSVTTDNEGRILRCRKQDGTVIENCDVEYPNGIPTDIKNYVKGQIDQIVPNVLQGKRVAIMGDSISTMYGKNTPYWKVKAIDVGTTIQSYVTFYDVYTLPNKSVTTGKTIGGNLLTEDMIGTLQSFVPIAEDVGKEIGVPTNYNGSGIKIWAEVLCELTGAELIANASWSGASMCSGQPGDYYLLSHGFSDYTVGRCHTRDDDGNYIDPDVIILYRGTNDFSHPMKNNSGYAILEDYDLLTNAIPVTDKTENDKYSFVRAYYMTIKALRDAYPKAIIYCATLNVFKRIEYDRFPTRNGTNTLPEFSNAIRDIANTMGCGLIEFDKDGITFENCYSEGYITDSSTQPTHPNNKGHYVMGVRAMRDLTYTL